MATLNENIAKTKDNFRNIRNAINDVGDAVAFEPLINEPVEEYPARINDVAEMYGQSKYDEGYEHGDEDGKAEILAESKYIPKQATGKVISLTDVSEVAHKVKVYGDGEVDIYGKNLFDGVLEAGGINSENGTDYETSVSKRSANYIPIQPNTTYTVSRENTTGNIRMRFYDKDKNYLGYGFAATVTPLTFTAKENYYYLRLDLLRDVGNLTEKVQVEIGNKTPYEPYNHQTITATSNGTKVSSLCPNMNFFADSDIAVDYYSSFGMAESQNRFANSFQNNGKKQDYTYAFWGSSWNDYTFEQAVSQDIIATSANQMFYNSKITDLAAIMKKKNISFIFEGTGSNFVNIFQSSTVTHIPVLVMPEKAGASALARTCKSLHTIDGMVCNENTKFDNSFQSCESLTHCIFSGVIFNDINLQWSPLLDDETLISLSVTLQNLWLDSDGNPIEGTVPDRTLTVHPDVLQRLKELPYPVDDYIIPTCFEAIIEKGWNIA